MRVKALLAVLLIVAVIASTFGVTTGSESGNNLSTRNETDNVTFEEFEFGNTTVLWHQRQIGDAIVEGDFINRQVDTNSGGFKSETCHWREGLPTELPQNLTTEAEALKIAGGGEYACLYYLSPNSTIYRPAPETPVWIVWHDHEPDKWGNVTVIDAVTGEFIASGIPPILSNEVLPSRLDSTVVLDNGVEATFLGRTLDGDYQWQATFTTSSSDGYLYFESAREYSVARGAPEANVPPRTSCDWLCIGQTFEGGVYDIWRSFVYFDTASLPSEASIASATLRLYGGEDYSDQDFYIQIQSGMPDHPCSPMTEADYNKNYYSGNGGRLATTNFVEGSYNEILLTSEGKSWINTTGWTKLCLRSSRDINPLNTPAKCELVNVWAYEMGEDYWPELVVTYETSGDIIDAFIFTGPIYTGDPCFDGWYIFVDNVEKWLGEMGYEVFRPVGYPNASVLEQYIGNNEIAVFYEHCHGGVDYFWNSCDDMTYDEEVEAWLANYPKIPFVFLANCNGLCEIGPDTLVGAFSKGSLQCGVIVGYCGMSFERCRDCAEYRYFWEETFFSALADGYTVEEAYNLSTNKYPRCEDCILYYGDGDIQLSEKIERGLCSPSGIITGEVRDVNGELLYGLEVCLHKEDGTLVSCTIASPTYSFNVTELGRYYLVANP